MARVGLELEDGTPVATCDGCGQPLLAYELIRRRLQVAREALAQIAECLARGDAASLEEAKRLTRVGGSRFVSMDVKMRATD